MGRGPLTEYGSKSLIGSSETIVAPGSPFDMLRWLPNRVASLVLDDLRARGFDVLRIFRRSSKSSLGIYTENDRTQTIQTSVTSIDIHIILRLLPLHHKTPSHLSPWHQPHTQTLELIQKLLKLPKCFLPVSVAKLSSSPESTVGVLALQPRRLL